MDMEMKMIIGIKIILTAMSNGVRLKLSKGIRQKGKIRTTIMTYSWHV